MFLIFTHVDIVHVCENNNFPWERIDEHVDH